MWESDVFGNCKKTNIIKEEECSSGTMRMKSGDLETDTVRHNYKEL